LFLGGLMKLVSLWTRLPGWGRILVALLLGVIVGLVGRSHVTWLAPIGQIFINAIHLLIAPVIFSAIVCAILSVHNANKMGRMTLRALIWYLGCMLLASIIGLLFAKLIHPGTGVHLSLSSSYPITSHQTQPRDLSGFLSGLVTSNPLRSFLEDNVLQIVIFAILLGVAINMAGEKGKVVANFFFSFSQVAFKLAELIMKFAPYGVFALIAWTFATFGFLALMPLVKFIFTVYLGCAVMISVVYGGFLWFRLRLSLAVFMRAIASAFLFAFTTSSSAATLPLSMKCCEENLNIKEEFSRFLLPLGASFNLNGLSIYLTVAVIFAANLYGIHLSLMDQVLIVLTTVVSAMGAAAVPGSALIVMAAIMSAIHIPLGAIALIAGVDRLNDMAQTATNVTGDIFVTKMVSESESR
jgi:DAACS family dicarboxylate/amino acid:cation (Na+ or H+) symporter